MAQPGGGAAIDFVRVVTQNRPRMFANICRRIGKSKTDEQSFE